MAKKHVTDSELAAQADNRARAAAAERARELERSGYTGLARAFRDYAERRTDGRSLSLADYLAPDPIAANAARSRDSDAPGSQPGYVPPAHPAPDAVSGRYFGRADAVPDADEHSRRVARESAIRDARTDADPDADPDA